MSPQKQGKRNRPKTTAPDCVVIDLIRDYVRYYVWRHRLRMAAEGLGVSRHTLWRFLERGHMGCSLACAPGSTLSRVRERR